MMGNDSIDVGLGNIWKAWAAFRKGKRVTDELHTFQYDLEKNLCSLQKDLEDGTYQHGPYRTFIVSDNKRREISVASIQDRVVHRLVYDHLKVIYDKTFIHDAWSCRPNKGLLAAIERTQAFLKKYPRFFVWKGDVKKFFDSVDHTTLLAIASRRIKDTRTYDLIRKIVESFAVDKMGGGDCGIPIGNLTSQIFANIYLNEFDRFVKHRLKPKAYLRYGDDFVLFGNDRTQVATFLHESKVFLKDFLKLELNPRGGIFKAKHGLKFLGVVLWPKGRNLSQRNIRRVKERLNLRNASSYRGLISKHQGIRGIKEFDWRVSAQLYST